MITVKYNPDNLKLTIQGHGGGKKGFDIVCAGASMLFYTLANVLAHYPDDHFVEIPDIVEGDGTGKIKCKPLDRHIPTIKHDFAYAMVGFALLEENYPDRVKVVISHNKK